MTIIICCFMKIRIPRTKREIELHAAMRKSERRKSQQKRKQDLGMALIETGGQNTQLIVMKTTPTRSTVQSVTDTDNTGKQESSVTDTITPADKQGDLMAFESGDMTSSSATAAGGTSTDEMQTSATTIVVKKEQATNV